MILINVIRPSEHRKGTNKITVLTVLLILCCGKQSTKLISLVFSVLFSYSFLFSFPLFHHFFIFLTYFFLSLLLSITPSFFTHKNKKLISYFFSLFLPFSQFLPSPTLLCCSHLIKQHSVVVIHATN